MKLYKKSLLYGVVALTLCMTGGCNSNIDLEPQGIITADGYFKSLEDYEKALNGIYGRLNYDNYALWMDGVSDNGMVDHSWNWGYDLALGIGNTQSSFSSDRWKRGYISVQRANNIINNIDKFAWPGGEADADRNRVLGEARTIRAFFYLDLVATYGRIMFYTENPVTVAESETIEQIEDPKVVFDFLVNDMKEVIADLPEKSANSSKIGKPAARLLRARIASYAAGYLNDKSYYQITLEETKELIANAPTLGEYNDLFVDGCENIDEVILARTYSLDKKNDWGNWYNQSLGGYCVTVPVKSLVDAYEYIGTKDEKMPYVNKDPRLYASIYVPGSEMRGKYFNTIPNNVIEKDGKTYFDPNKDYGSLQEMEVSVGDALGEGGGGEWNKTQSGFAWKKYCQGDETWTTYNPFVIFRYAEAYLLRAEALVETNGSADEAKALVKVIRDRAGNTNDIDQVVADLYQGSLRDLIRNEFRVEFAQEGLRFFDVRRWKILLDVMNKPIEGIEYRDYSSGTPVRKVHIPAVRENYANRDYWWPIPQAEIDLNKGRITQNEEW